MCHGGEGKELEKDGLGGLEVSFWCWEVFGLEDCDAYATWKVLSAPSGAFYGLQVLLQLKNKTGQEVRAGLGVRLYLCGGRRGGEGRGC